MRHAMAFLTATILTLVCIIGSGHCQETTGSVGNPYQSLAGDSEQRTRSGWIPTVREWENASPTRGTDTDYQRRLREAYDGDLKAAGVQDSSSNKTIAYTKEVDFTPEHIKKQGNENKNYVVMISADWCSWCKKMYPMVEELRSEGYIVYVFETTRPEFKDYAALYNINSYPTFIIYDKGKEVTRTAGFTDKSWFTSQVKTKDQQEEQKPVNPYDGL